MGELKGKQIQPRDLARIFHDAGWTSALHLMEAVQVCLAESQGFTEAVNDNVQDGKTLSRDVGIWQINIPASQIGSAREADLYDVEYNTAAARALYVDRGWQPWVAWNSNVCFRDTYVKRAARGVGNFLAERALAHTPTDTLKGEPYVHTLVSPVLDYYYRVDGMASAHRAVIARARQLKPIGGPAVDAKADEIIGLAVEGAAWPTL